MKLKEKKILLIEDTQAIRTFLRISLQAFGATVYEASTAAQGLLLNISKQPDLIILDLGLPDRDGLDIIQELKADIAKRSVEESPNGSPCKIVILSVRKDTKTKEIAFAKGADAYMVKPFLMEDFLELIDEKL